MPISYTTIPRTSAPTYSDVPTPSVPAYSSISEILDDILDESGGAILDELSGRLKSEQKVDVFTSIPRPS